MTKPSFTKFHPNGDPKTGMETTNFVAPDAILEGTAHEKGSHFFTNARGNFMGGVWECSPMKEKFENYPYDEFMVILEGRVTLTDEDGNEETFVKGDALSLDKGFTGTWTITETLKKYYIILE